jgi:hypothetical protein
MRALTIGLAVLALLLASPPPSRADIDVKAAKVKLLESISQYVDAEIKTLEAQIDAETRPEVRTQLGKALAELKLLKKRVVDDVGAVDALWDSITGAKKALEELDTAVDRAWVGPLHTHLLAAKKVSALVKASEIAGQGVDYYYKFKKLGEDISAIDSALLSPGTKRMAQSLTALSHILSIFGDKAPLFGSLLKAYGDLAVELTKVTLALDSKIEAREQGQLLPGVHGERGEMLDQLSKLGLGDGERVDGTRDVFRAGGKLLIWDRAVRGWVIASDLEPGITEDEIIKRYLFFTSRGTAEPSPEQIVRGYHRAIIVKLEPSTDHVAPGGAVTFKVTGRTAHDDRVVEKRELYATIKMTSHTGIGEGEMPGAERVKIGESITWTAPNNVNETYNFSVDLAAETAKVAVSGGASTVSVRTGYETRLELTAAAREVAAGTPIELTAKLFTVDGKPMPPTVAGSIELTVDPGLGFFADWVAQSEQKGTRFTWMAPEQAGQYVFTARYGGATGYGMFGDHTAGAEAKVTIVVGAPRGDAGLADAGPDDAGEPIDEEVADAAEVDALVDAGDLDFPGTWRGKIKTSLTMDGTSNTSTEAIELVVKRRVDGTLSLAKLGNPEIVLTPTPSNPRAATANVPMPKPDTPVIAGSRHLSWKAEQKWAVFLADGKLNFALRISIEQVVEVTVVDTVTQKSSSFVSDSIGVLERIGPP